MVWGTIFGLLALACCGLPIVDKQPLGLIIWVIGGALFGTVYAGGLTRAWRSSQARKKLCRMWCLIEEDGQPVLDSEAKLRRLTLRGTAYTEQLGDDDQVRGSYWIDPLAEPPAISFTPQTPSDSGASRQGIYRLERERLTICLAYPGHPRPTSFVARSNVQQLRIYRGGGKASKAAP
jgi:uncharacterized protein (TIGR03067 family)